MQFSFIPCKYGEELSCDGLSGIPKEYLNDLFADLDESKINYELKEANYGKGADWIWLVVSFGVIIQLISLGDKIDKGLNGWGNIYKKIKKLLRKSGVKKMDDDVLLLFAAAEIFKSDKKIRELTYMAKTSLDLANNFGAFIGKAPDHFLSKDDNYTIFVFKSRNKLYIVGTRITGTFEILKELPLNQQ